MNKILPILVLSIFVLDGLGAVAIPNNKKIENKPLNMQDFELEISIQGGFFGYIINVINKGTEPVSGNLTIEITTNAMVMLLGQTLSKELTIAIDPGSAEGEFKLTPILGFGDATISISGVFRTEHGEYPFEILNDRGYIFLIYIVFSEIIFYFP